MPKHLTHTQYIAFSAVIAVAILVVGVILKPKELPAPTVSGEEILRLQRLTVRRNLENLAVYYSEIASDIQPGLVWLEELGMTGIVWNGDGMIVTAGPAGPGAGAITALTTSGSVALERTLFSRHFRSAVLQAPKDSQLKPVPKGSTQGMTAGVSILQVARQAGGNYVFTPGAYGGIVSMRCGGVEYQALQSNIPLTEPLLGGGIFDVDGNLLAVVARCDGKFAALLPTEMDREIGRASSLEGQLLRGYGIQLNPLDEFMRDYCRCSEGIVVRGVSGGQLADTAGLIPGDVITTLDKQPVAGIENLKPLASADATEFSEVTVRRGPRTIRLKLQRAGGSMRDRVPAGIAVTGLARGYRVDSVVRGSRAARGGLQEGDWLLQIDGKPPQSADAVRSVLSDDGAKPAFVVLHRGSQRIGLILK